MKKSKIRFVVLLLLGGCAVPAPVVKLTPSTIENKDYWNMGQQFVFTNNQNVWFDCAFNRCERGKLIFDVKITNESDTAVLVDPVAFYQEVFKNDTARIASDPATDPEVFLELLQLNENTNIARAKNARALSICSAVISTGASVAVVSSKKSDEEKVNALDAIRASNTLTQIAATSMGEAADIRAQDNWTTRRSLSEAFLRKTTLPSGSYIDGEVHFPYNQYARWYRLVFSAGKAMADFHFRQRLIYPDNGTGNRSSVARN